MISQLEMFFSLKNIPKKHAIRHKSFFTVFNSRFERMIATVNRLLTVVKENLPQDMGDNPVLTNLLNNLYITADNAVPKKVIQILLDEYKLLWLR